jgi:hypothetical protein
MALRRRSVRIGTLAVITAVALFEVWANIGMAITPNEEWTTAQGLRYVEAQKTISDVTGHPLKSNVIRGHDLPAWAPADQLDVVGDCQGLYISNGEDYSTVPDQQFQRNTWMAIERGHQFQHEFRLVVTTAGRVDSALTPLVNAGDTRLFVRTSPLPGGQIRVRFLLQGPSGTFRSLSTYISPGSAHQAVLITDPVKHLTQVFFDGTLELSGVLNVGEPIVATSPSVAGTGVAVVNTTNASPQPTLCQSLIH